MASRTKVLPDLLLVLAFSSFALADGPRVQLGIDVLAGQQFQLLRGKRVGLVTNQTGVDGRGTRTRVVLKRHVDLVALYTPEHGLDGTELAGKYVATRRDPLTGLLAHSLYGPTRKPTPAMLKGVDVLVFDLQDIGCRCYTYISTMIKCMEAAGEARIPFVVLDRPNPLGGLRVEGPPMEARWISFIGQVPTPYVPGLTAGEIARMANALGWASPRCDLRVVRMKGWRRDMVWDDTELGWVKPSPNIPRADTPAYYVATGMLGELKGIEGGCGGPTPFEIIAAKGLESRSFTAKMSSLGLPGVRFSPYERMGARLTIDPRTPANLTGLNIHGLAAVYRGAPNVFKRSRGSHLELFFKAYGSASIRRQIERGVPAHRIIDGWTPSVARFRVARQPFLLY
ncbi:MAG: DUF1343 domain-containing protein [Candidatus Riflebacteria bacterium]|nr:DUF1343 domain-containing protein [Candidatus Riflebacteria bacterium]